MFCVFSPFLCSTLNAGSVETLCRAVMKTRTVVWCFYELSVWRTINNGRTLFICFSSGFMELKPFTFTAIKSMPLLREWLRLLNIKSKGVVFPPSNPITYCFSLCKHNYMFRPLKDYRLSQSKLY